MAPTGERGRESAERFCRSCGQAIHRDAAICLQCGVAVQHTMSPGAPLASSLGAVQPKDKSVALLLAIFLSFWTWLYTFQRDQTKFWIGLGGSILGGILLFVVVGILPVLGIWIWAIIDTATKPDSFYRQFPYG